LYLQHNSVAVKSLKGSRPRPRQTKGPIRAWIWPKRARLAGRRSNPFPVKAYPARSTRAWRRVRPLWTKDSPAMAHDDPHAAGGEAAKPARLRRSDAEPRGTARTGYGRFDGDWVQKGFRRTLDGKRKARSELRSGLKMRPGTAYRIPGNSSHESQPRLRSAAKRRMRHMRQDP
jgi:hypothetical protein